MIIKEESDYNQYSVKNGLGKPYFEHKYIIDRSRFLILEKFFKSRYGGSIPFQQSRIKTIYFDTSDLKLYHQSIDGEYSKVKLRLREYLGQTDNKGARYLLEAKLKKGPSVEKYKIYLFGSQPLKFFTFSDLLHSIKKIYNLNTDFFSGFASFGPLYPIAEIIYKRKRFLEINREERYNLDEQISAKLLYRNLPYKRAAIDAPFSVFEIKGLCELNNDLTLAKTSFSKYTYSLENILR